METQNAVSAQSQDPSHQKLQAGGAREVLSVPDGGIDLRLKAERVQEPQTVVAAESTVFVYEIAVNRPQPVSIRISGLEITVTLHGDAAQAA